MKSMKPIFVAIALCLPLAVFPSLSGCNGMQAGFVAMEDRTAEGSQSYRKYLLYIPRAYDRDKQRLWPLIIFLHGMGAGSSDLQALRKMTLGGRLEGDGDFPFIVASPQCKPSESWKAEKVARFAQGLASRVRVDKRRMYLTGISTGGWGTWETAMAYPGLFAAIVPLAGFCDESKASLLKAVPAWAFHGENDRDASPLFSINMVKAINNSGGSAKLTLLKGVGHNCLREVYNNEELYGWLKEQSLR